MQELEWRGDDVALHTFGKIVSEGLDQSVVLIIFYVKLLK